LQRLDELGLELGADLAQLLELRAAHELRADRRVTAHAVLAGLEEDLPRAVLAVLLVLCRGLPELAMTASDLGHDLRLDPLELVAIAEVRFLELRVRELRGDPLVGALVELLAQPARGVDP